MKLTEKEKQRRLKRCAGKSLDITNPEILKEWDYEANEDLTPQMVTAGSSTDDINWICTLGHKYKAKICHRLKGNGQNCPYCSRHKVLQGFNDLATLYPDIAAEWDYEKNKGLKNKRGEDCSLPTLVTPGSCAVKPFWICKKYHHSWQQLVHVRVAGNNCPYCSGQKVLKGFNDLATTNPELLGLWDYENNTLKPTEVMHGSEKVVFWKCDKGHSWKSRINNVVHGNRCGVCRRTQIVTGTNDFATLYPDLLKDWDYEDNTVDPTKIAPKTSDLDIVWKCHKCNHKWITQLCQRTSGKTNCPYCSSSSTEKKIFTLFDENGIKYTFQKRFKNDAIVGRFWFDFYVDDSNVIIEADGIQHFEDSKIFRGVTFERANKNSNKKNKYCLENNIPILRIPYTIVDKAMIKLIVFGFLKTKQVPQAIIDFYSKYECSNYASIAIEMNRRQSCS